MNLFCFYIIKTFFYNRRKIFIFIIIAFLSKYFQESIKFNKIDNFFEFCNNYQSTIKKKYKKNKNPKISIISPIYNREKYLLRFLISIQNQNFNNLEIIFIDDCSKDNSVNVIKKYQENDQRIILIKQNKNKGTFIARNLGALYSRGEYLIFPDPDDILSKDILNYCYYFAEKHNFEMIRFNIYLGKGTIMLNNIIEGIKSRPVYQPELSTYLFYAKGFLCQIDHNLSNKFIKRTAYIRALNYFSDFYLNLYLIYFEDGVMNYILYRIAKSFYFIKKLGYFYIINNQSITINLSTVSREYFKSIFIYLKLIFEYSKNTKYEKDMANCLLGDIFEYKITNGLIILEKDNKFYRDVINKFLESNFISNINKNELKKLIK
jgi:glycosyltransferase involved in cell wall biosynthesis